MAYLAFGLCQPVSAQTPKRLYIGIDDHTDYMWTADEATYDSAFVHMLDYYLNQIDSTKSDPSNFQSRFNCDGSYFLKAYEKYRSPAQFMRLMQAIRSGHISSPLNMLVNTFGAQPSEAVIRGMYYAGSLERRHNLRFTMAGAMENNTLPLGLSSLWAGSGVKYSWKGIGGYGSQLSYEVRKYRKHQLYRYTGLDSSSLLTKWYQFDEDKTAPLGGYAECRLIIKSVDTTKELGEVIDVLDKFCDTTSSRSNYPYNVAAAFGYGHDDLETYISKPYIEAATIGTNSQRTVRVSNQEDFFKDIEKTYPKLPSQTVSFGNEWDTYCASMNETTAEVRRSTEKLRTAEALASVVSLRKPDFAKSLDGMRDKAWDGFGMYWEHNWTGDGPVKQPVRAAWQIKMQKQISDYVDTLHQLAVNTLGEQIKKSRNARFFVFNSLSWNRSDVVDILYNGNKQIRIVDLTSKKGVASQLISKGDKTYIRIYAENVPSVGYKVFEIQHRDPEDVSTSLKVESDYISNSLYKVRLTKSGVITELTDLKTNKQLVRKTDGKYLNDLGTSDVDSGQPVVIENAGPVSITLKAVSADPVPHTVRLTLYNNIERIEIEDSIQSNFTDVKSWAFSLNLKNPTTHHEELAAILTAKKEKRGGHYSDQIARYDWLTFNHFADLSESDYGVTISNLDCSFFKLGSSTLDSLWEQSSQLNALAGGQIDKTVEHGGALGIYGQNGQTDFAYQFALMIHPAAFDPVKSLKFALEHQNPLTAGMITGTKQSMKGNEFSFLSINDPNVLLWSIKPSEDGFRNGLITRFWNMSNKSVSPRITLSSVIRSVWQTSHIETDQKEVVRKDELLSIPLRQHQMGSYRILLRE